VRLGYNTNGMHGHRLADALALLAEHGYTAVALTLDVMHLDPFACTAAQVRAVARELHAFGLLPVIETGARYLLDPRRKHEPTLMAADAAGRARRLDFYRRAAAVGRDLGAQVVSFWTGIDRAPGADSAGRLRDGVAAACDAIRAAGLRPALEPEPEHAVATLDGYARLAGELGPGAPELCLDVGHLYVTAEAEPAAAIARFAPRLAQVHLEDMKRGVHEHLPPGAGDVDFAAVRGALERTGYRGAVCFELSRSSHAAPAMLALCRSAWDRAGAARR
jgi:ribosomal protein S12 methylthiotransferase accessory factor